MTGSNAEMRQIDTDRGENPVVLALDVRIEQKLGACRTGQPAILRDLNFQLTCAPARMTGVKL